MSKYVIRKRKIKSTKSRDEKVSLELAFETVIVGVRRKSSGSEFQTAGPAYEKARSANFVRDRSGPVSLSWPNHFPFSGHNVKF